MSPESALAPVSPLPSLRTSHADLLSAIARLIAARQTTTAGELVATTGLARSTVAGVIDQLGRAGWVTAQEGRQDGTRGRPARLLRIGSAAGLVLGIDLDATLARVGIGEIAGRVRSRVRFAVDLQDGPRQVLNEVSGKLEDRLPQIGVHRPLRAVVVAVPARVDISTGRAIRPNLMPGWDGFPIAHFLEDRFGAPALLENDCNARAVAEAAALGADQRPLVVVKMSTGVGAGIIGADGTVLHGSDGSAGDIGHVPVPGAADLPCTCGRVGCVEASTAIGSVARLVRQRHPGALADGASHASDIERLVELLRIADPRVTAIARDAGKVLGEVVAILCNVINPRRVIIDGPLTEATDDILAEVRAVAYQAARPLATRGLHISHSTFGEEAGLRGALVLARELALSPPNLAKAFGLS